MTRSEFMFSGNFPDIPMSQIEEADKYVRSWFYGVRTLWHTLPKEAREEKRELCYQLLTAWYLADMHPGETVGAIANGGMAISSKSIGGTSLSFKDLGDQKDLSFLNSNVFGQKALAMFLGAPERFGAYAY